MTAFLQNTLCLFTIIVLVFSLLSSFSVENVWMSRAETMGEVPKIEWAPREDARDEVQKRLKDDEGGS